MRPSTHPQALRVAAALGSGFTVVEFDESTHTAQEAADAIGCQLAQIAKSILFRSASGRPVLVIASGTNRVDEKKVKALLGEKIERASPDFVKEMTGYEVGGVPPLGHASACVVYLDEDLKAYPTLWAAGGTPNAVFEIGFEKLAEMSGATVADVKKFS
ncbi:YbaK/EbsC family protein [Aestuariivirga litoralis]|uniref:YbaK/EbsC family protein n=1 Tax=Aestuariivirga litoralis TaxID=2650924 RepID=A0A2W2AYY1_9HYPH|nr:YbaK/EbsC family protein [Aestuariivirga litoralis]PZF77820.1 YbaK/EbsC family protein [Aestuariivirga litoralis]